MSTALALIPRPELPPSLSIVPTRDLAVVAATARERVREYIDATTAPNTKAAYAADWRHFTEWCAALGIMALPASADSVIAYLSELPSMALSEVHGRGMRKDSRTGYSISTITRRLATISREHKQRGFPSPCAD